MDENDYNIQRYSSVVKVLRSAKSIKEASDIVLTKYEKPANQSESVKKKRAEYGKKIFDRQMGITSDETKKTDSNEKQNTVIKHTLRNGDSGKEVKELQKLLIGHGYDLGKYGADGKFGDKTEEAVKKFQKANQLVVDGVAGKKTLSKLLAQ